MNMKRTIRALAEYHGNDKPDGTSEYLCPDCPTDYPEED